MYLSHHKSHHLSFCSLYVIWSKPHIFHEFIYGVSLSSIPFSLSITFALWAHQLVLLAQSLFLQHRHSVCLDSLVWTKSHYPLQKLLHCLLNIGLLFFLPSVLYQERGFPPHLHCHFLVVIPSFPTRFLVLMQLLPSSLLVSHSFTSGDQLFRFAWDCGGCHGQGTSTYKTSTSRSSFSWLPVILSVLLALKTQEH